MATASELFMAVNNEVEPHIVVNSDRSITVPTELKIIGIQYDHNVETVIFDCPRYWDEHDLSTMRICISYICSGNHEGVHMCESVTTDETDENIIHFDWTVTGNVTLRSGQIKFLVCAQNIDESGNVEQRWHTQICSDCEILPGIECGNSENDNSTVIPDNYDFHERFDEVLAELETTKMLANAASAAANVAKTTADTKAPINHASYETAYGLGSDAVYGHVKLSDSTIDTSDVTKGVAATPSAVNQVYNIATTAQNVADTKAPIDHASTDVTYGKANKDNYGHVRLSSSFASFQGVGEGVAATPYAVKQTYDKAVEAAEAAAAAQTSADEKAVKKHASSYDSFGLGTRTAYGHLKLSNDLDDTSGVASGTAATPFTVNKLYKRTGTHIFRAGYKIVETNSSSYMAKVFTSSQLNTLFGTSGVSYTNANCVVIGMTGDYAAFSNPIVTGYNPSDTSWYIYSTNGNSLPAGQVRINYLAIAF